eukprot:1667139-Alexandrium_andersonii.AAC.1
MCGGECSTSRPPEERADLVLSQAQRGPPRRSLLTCRIREEHNWSLEEAMHISVTNPRVLRQVLNRLRCAQNGEGAHVPRQGLPRG